MSLDWQQLVTHAIGFLITLWLLKKLAWGPLLDLMEERRNRIAGEFQTIEDEKAKGVPGIEVWVTWEGGADRFVTGLKPEEGPGYGDFDMQPGIGYDVAVAESALPLVKGLETEQCPSADATQRIMASWQLTFRPIPPTPTPTATLGPSPTLTFSVTATPGFTATASVTRKP